MSKIVCEFREIEKLWDSFLNLFYKISPVNGSERARNVRMTFNLLFLQVVQEQFLQVQDPPQLQVPAKHKHTKQIWLILPFTVKWSNKPQQP